MLIFYHAYLTSCHYLSCGGIGGKVLQFCGHHFLCHQCHHMIDNDKSLDKHDRIAAWEEAHRKTIGWLFTNNHIQIK